jgi:hypothetical protein
VTNSFVTWLVSRMPLAIWSMPVVCCCTDAAICWADCAASEFAAAS